MFSPREHDCTTLVYKCAYRDRQLDCYWTINVHRPYHQSQRHTVPAALIMAADGICHPTLVALVTCRHRPQGRCSIFRTGFTLIYAAVSIIYLFIYFENRQRTGIGH